MARTFHRDVNGQTRVWTIDLRDEALIVTTGQAGRPGRTSERTFRDADTAAHALVEAIRSMVEAGWEEQLTPRLLPEELWLDPADATSFLVHADRLAEAGDPRGGFIQLQVAPPSPEGRDQERRLLALHAATWLGQLPVSARITWRWGFLDAVELAVEGSGAEAANVLRTLHERGSLPALRHLTATGSGSLEPLLHVLDGLSVPWLRQLTLEGSGRAQVARLLGGRPHLRDIALSADALEVSGLQHEQLTTLSLAFQQLDPAELVPRELPRLKTLLLGARTPWTPERVHLERALRGVPELVLAGHAASEGLDSLLGPLPGLQRLTLLDPPDRGRMLERLAARRDALTGVTVALRGVDLSDGEVRHLEPLDLDLELHETLTRRADHRADHQALWTELRRTRKGVARFWAVQREGALLRSRHGRVGSVGTLSETSFNTDRLAAAEYRRRLSRKQAEGWDLFLEEGE